VKREDEKPDDTIKETATAETKRNADSAEIKVVNFIIQGEAPASCYFFPRLQQSILRRRRRFG
jgi:hypothetical protein